MDEEISQEKLKSCKEDLKSEIAHLEESLEKIIGVRCLLSLGERIQSTDVLRNVIAKEVALINDDINDILQVFKSKIETIFASLNNPTILNVEVTMSDASDIMKNSPVNHEAIGNRARNVHLEVNNDVKSKDFVSALKINHAPGNSGTKIKVEIEGPETWCYSQESSKNFKILSKFCCTECNCAFATHLDLKYHNRECHNMDGISCPICNKLLKYPSDADMHMRCAHTGEKPFTCTVCGKTFSRESSFKSHQRIHSLVRPFSCKTCGKSFRSKQNARSHNILHERSNKFVCSTCGKCFLRSQNLLQHMKTHKVTTGTPRKKRRKRKA